ncbi:nucleoside recognition domain-containing protein [Paenibacillus sp. p3-SID1389]|uniref:nucleoside recognition domain-containing protein n=1 Tax=Paenibacillus sp. p3-SID1389 TaxID=2916364 RepID=UPI0021A66514|nr:nucleoside recognition domain-containing protein [Paenibacillus sp. p3-SID1389]MCT2196154.1 nucleoside recognition domain-containing protein [Paenibacillus sp. p3-SID1389]
MNFRRLAASPLSTWLTGFLAVLLVICVVYAPGEAFKASGEGLAIWWRIVFPALLPFIVLSQMLIASGFAHGLGALLEPFTRRALGLPGSFGWVLPLGMTAGFPAAAEAAVTLHKQGKVTAREAERLAAAAHFCSPMLLVVVIGAGFLSRPEVGLLLLAVHWIAGLAAGVTLQLVFPDRSKSAVSPPVKPAARPRESILRLAMRRMEEARREDGRSFGKLLGDAVASGVQTLMIIGGYMLIFAVVIHVILLAFPNQTMAVAVKSALEVHLGSYALSGLAPSLPPALSASLLGAVLGWSGLCAYLQVRAILGPAGIGERSFLLSRLLHAAYAYVLTLLLWKPVTRWLPNVLPAFGGSEASPIGSDTPAVKLPSWQQAFGVMEWQLWMLTLLTVGFLSIALLWRRQEKP